MRKDIHNVRKNIADRKRKKGIQSIHRAKTPKFAAPQDEEMHGYPPLVVSDKITGTSTNSSSIIRVQAIASILLFLTVLASEQTSAGIAEKPREWMSNQLQEEFPFAKVTAWYNDRLGGPLQLVDQKESPTLEESALPVNGVVTQPFENHGRGVIMSTEQGEEVKAVKSGTVIFAGNDKETDKTIIIQHEDGSNTTYGFLSTIDVHLYEHIPSYDTIGTLNEKESNEFFFAVEKDKQYLDPIEVIKVDEGS
ncbi:M23 family metallopeptidase [Halobacillus sp. A5]|uniref:M23 family metallopeptidase n=1 Tax=Halobacillus sp. A5 TaxID=2880263 RepID=UPI0020A63DB6|nr:M23 family metallopeptidase [Halobacillus sp. A5]MCP3025541.1 M23 family metallopeptidase [Halobacillus sp. A5]